MTSIQEMIDEKTPIKLPKAVQGEILQRMELLKTLLQAAQSIICYV